MPWTNLHFWEQHRYYKEKVTA